MKIFEMIICQVGGSKIHQENIRALDMEKAISKVGKTYKKIDWEDKSEYWAEGYFTSQGLNLTITLEGEKPKEVTLSTTLAKDEPKIKDQIQVKSVFNLFLYILAIPLFICFPLLLVYPILKFTMKGRGMKYEDENGEDIL